MLKLKSRIEILKDNTASIEAKKIVENALKKYENVSISESYLSQFENFVSQDLVENLKDINDDAVKVFLIREKRLLKINNLGIKDTIKKIKESEIFNHPTMKYMIEQFKNIDVIPEYLIIEQFIDKIKPYLFDEVVKEQHQILEDNYKEFKEDIILFKSIYEFKNSSSSYLLKAFEKELDEFVINRNKQTKTKLLEKLENYKFDLFTRKLSNLIKENTGEFQLMSAQGQTNVENIYSPVIESGEKTIFFSSGTYFEKTNNSIRKLDENEINKISDKFKALSIFINQPNVKVNEENAIIYSGDKKVEINKGEKEFEIFINENKVSLKNFNKIFMNAGIFHQAEIDTMNNVYNLLENFNSIKDLHFAKRVASNILEKFHVDVFNIGEKIYINKLNGKLKINEFKELNATQTRKEIYEFMQYDIAESFKNLLSKEESVLNDIKNKQKKLTENISYLEKLKEDTLSKIGNDKELLEDNDVKELIETIENEIEILKKAHSSLTAKIDNLTNESNSDEKVNEDHIAPGTKVECTETGENGTVQSWNDNEGHYIVLTSAGKTIEVKDDGIKILEQKIDEKYTRDSLLKKLGKTDDAFIKVKGDSDKYLIKNPDSNNDANAAMWKDDTITVINYDGDDIEFKYSDITKMFFENKEIKEDLSTTLSDEQKGSIDVMMGKGMKDDDILKILNTFNKDVDNTEEILQYMKNAKGPEKLKSDEDALKEKIDSDKIDLEKNEENKKEDIVKNEEKEYPIKAGDKVKLKNGVHGTVQSVDMNNKEAIVNMDDGKTISIPEEKFNEIEIISKKSEEKNSELKNTKDGNTNQVEEGKEEWIEGELIDKKGKPTGEKIEVNALEYTSKGEKDKITIKRNNKIEKIEKKYIKV